MLDDQYLSRANNLLKEARYKLLLDVDEEGQPNCSIHELIDFWDRLKNHLNETSI